MLTETDSYWIEPRDWLHPLPLSDCFSKPEQPLEIDLGCGKGRFLLARAQAHPDVNFLGIDRILVRLKKIERKTRRAGLDNVRLFRMDAYYAVTYLLPPDAVRAFYIFFPDPWPKTRHHDHRLFNEPFVRAVLRSLVPGGRLHVATDHLPYYEEILDLLKREPGLEQTEVFEPPQEQKTDFELLFLDSKPIGRCSFSKRPPAVSPSIGATA